MLRRKHLFRAFVAVTLFYGIHTVISQYTFETFLDSLQITFDNFPTEYARVLNNSVARNEQPIDFDYPSTFTNSTIPRIIHYIWFKNLYPSREGITEIPSVGSRSPELCREFNPGYEIRIWNTTHARSFIEREYKWFLSTYDGYRYPIQKVDALKYFVLWHYGGVYMDLDIACRRPLDPLLDSGAWFPKASPLGVNNDLMACRKHHPIMEKMTKGLVTHNRNLIFPYITIFWTTGPHFTSQILQEQYKQCRGDACLNRLHEKDSSK
ncbi:nucleotide-diphospho-sugar transferase [Dendryphion nanum]|uniref:Nucleotide-diphospho-sugar transferase n=1 Tax=Dendryphion nanum TaxID=256645 RepID=A0A9P9IG12_9PLEO|nr:nucleotide-diphospho-sugar transferase [Dendryphion nanum]